MKKIKFIELFAGVGGFRLGLDPKHFDFAWGSEIDRFAKQTYKANFGHDLAGDIRQVNKAEIPDHDLLVGGFPCQPFSAAGQKKGLTDHRGDLFFQIVEILEVKKPKYVLLENVPGILSIDGGRVITEIMNAFEKAGYCAEIKIINAADFIPQNRVRVFFLAKRGEPLKKVFTLKKNVSAPMAHTFFDKEVDDCHTLKDGTWNFLKNNRIDAGSKFRARVVEPKNCEKIDTITARYYGACMGELIAQPGKNPRRITPKEAFRFMGFPEDFIIPVSNTQAAKQAGNSVVVPVIKHLADMILVDHKKDIEK